VLEIEISLAAIESWVRSRRHKLRMIYSTCRGIIVSSSCAKGLLSLKKRDMEMSVCRFMALSTHFSAAATSRMNKDENNDDAFFILYDFTR
jgi:hypothetical protein